MTDCRREESWESAKRRKAMNGLSVSIVVDDELGADEILLSSDGAFDEDAISRSTDQIRSVCSRLKSLAEMRCFDGKQNALEGAS